MGRLPIAITGTTCGALASALILAGCQGTIGSPDNSTGTTNATITGVWNGTDSNGDTLAAFVDSDGAAVFILSNSTQLEQFDGNLQVSGSTLAASLDGYSNFGSTFSDGSTYGVGTLSGTVVSASSMTATLSFTTSDNTAISSTWTLTYNALSTAGSSLSAVTGNYTNTAGDTTLSIRTDGVLTGSTSSGCAINGNVTTDDTSYDIYQITYTYENCTGSYASLNDVPLTGLATLDNSASPSYLLLAVAGQTNSTSGSTTVTTNYGLTYSMNLD